jgi:hypothetical protein
MASLAVMQAVEARLRAEWNSGSPRCQIIGLSNSSDVLPPSDGAPFLTVEYPIVLEDIESLGERGVRLYREEGTITLILSLPKGSGVDEGLSWIDEIREIFRGVDFDFVETFAASPPVQRGDNLNGNYYLLSTAIPYRYDYSA